MNDTADQVTITLPDGKAMGHPSGVTGAEIAAAIGPGLAKAALVIEVDGAMWDLGRPIENDAQVRIITRKDPEALELIRHDAARVVAAGDGARALGGGGPLGEGSVSVGGGSESSEGSEGSEGEKLEGLHGSP